MKDSLKEIRESANELKTIKGNKQGYFFTFEMYRMFIMCKAPHIPFDIETLEGYNKKTGYIGKFNGSKFYIDG